MDISGLVIRIIFLLLPGALASSLYRKLKGRTTRKDWEDFLEIIIFSILSYIAYALILSVINYLRTKYGYASVSFSAFNAFFDEKAVIRWQEVLFASIIAVVLSFAAAFTYTKRHVNRIGNFIGVTNHVGEEDIWYFFLNSPDVQWVFVRDHKANIAYRCWIQYYSDPYKERELLLRDVDVYTNSTGELLYKRDAIYLSRKHDELTIEVPLESNTCSEVKSDGEVQTADTERD